MASLFKEKDILLESGKSTSRLISEHPTLYVTAVLAFISTDSSIVISYTLKKPRESRVLIVNVIGTSFVVKSDTTKSPYLP